MKVGFAFLACCFVTTGCADTLTLQLSFPSAATFVRVDRAQIYAVPAEAAGNCPNLTMQAENGTLGDEFLHSDTPICDLWEDNGGVDLPSAPSGLHAYITVARFGTTAYLSGCLERDLDAEPSSMLTLLLATTNAYRTTFPAGSPPPACSAETKCNEGCTE